MNYNYNGLYEILKYYFSVFFLGPTVQKKCEVSKF